MDRRWTDGADGTAGATVGRNKGRGRRMDGWMDGWTDGWRDGGGLALFPAGTADLLHDGRRIFFFFSGIGKLPVINRGLTGRNDVEYTGRRGRRQETGCLPFPPGLFPFPLSVPRGLRQNRKNEDDDDSSTFPAGIVSAAAAAILTSVAATRLRHPSTDRDPCG